MIILRQKKFSNPAVRRGVRVIGDVVIDARDKVYRLLGVGNPIVNEQIRQNGKRGVRKLSGRIARLVPGNKEQAKIMTQANKVRAMEAAVKAEEYAMTHTPGQAVGSVVGEVVRRPVFVGGTVAGYVPLKWGIYIPGTTAMAGAGEAAVRQAIPGYNWTTKELSAFYNRTLPRIKQSPRDILQNITNSACYAFQG